MSGAEHQKKALLERTKPVGGPCTVHPFTLTQHAPNTDTQKTMVHLNTTKYHSFFFSLYSDHHDY